MVSLKFDFRDLFRAPRLAFSLQRIWMQFLGIGLGYFFYLVFTFIAFILNGSSLHDVWQDFGLFPCLFAASGAVTWYSWFVFGVAAVGLLIAFLLTSTAVARAAYMVAKGNHFYSWREAFSYAWRKAGAVLVAPLSLLLLIGFFILASLLLGLIGKIPLIGNLGISLFAIIWFVCALLLIYLFIVCLTSFFLTPSIIATTDDDAFEVIFQTFSITWSQPWRLLIYEVSSMIIALFSLGIFAAFGKRAVMTTNTLLSAFMGSDYIALSNSGQALVQNWTLAGENFIRTVFRGFSQHIFFTNEFIYSPDSIAVAISSYLFAFSLLCLGGFILGYGFSTFTIGNTLAYLVMRHKKDGENLLERKDKEEHEEDSEEEKKEKTPEL